MCVFYVPYLWLYHVFDNIVKYFLIIPVLLSSGFSPPILVMDSSPSGSISKTSPGDI